MHVLPYAMLVSDLDGTLLTPQGTISTITKSTVQRLSANGVYIVLATGRHNCDAIAFLKMLDLPRPGYLVSSNGARIHCFDPSQPNESLKLILERSIEPDIVSKLFRLLPESEDEINLNVFQGDEWKCSLDWQDELKFYKESGFRYTLLQPYAVAKDYEQNRKSNIPNEANSLAGVGKISFGSDNTDRLHELEKRVLELFGDKVEVAFSSQYCLDISGKAVTKWSAIEELMHTIEHNGSLSAKNCVAFGDGMNDLHMLRSAGKSFIMSNGGQRLKETLPHVEIIGSNAEDGVATKIKELFGL